MSIRALKTFLAIAHHGTFAAAAAEIGVTQAAVSLQIKGLEAELKVRLFDRVGRTQVMTSAGRTLVSTASDVVKRYDSLALSLKSEDLGGSLRIGATSSTFAFVLPDALVNLKRHHPRIEVRVETGISSAIASRVESGELDAGLVLDPPGPLPNSLVMHHVTHAPMVLIAPRSMKITAARKVLISQPFIRLTRSGWGGRAIDSFLRENNIAVRAVMDLDTPDVIISMVAREFGVAIIPMYDEGWHRDSRLQVLRLSKPTLAVNIHMVERRSHARAALTAWLLSCLRSASARRKASTVKAIPL